MLPVNLISDTVVDNLFASNENIASEESGVRSVICVSLTFTSPNSFKSFATEMSLIGLECTSKLYNLVRFLIGVKSSIWFSDASSIWSSFKSFKASNDLTLFFPNLSCSSLDSFAKDVISIIEFSLSCNSFKFANLEKSKSVILFSDNPKSTNLIRLLITSTFSIWFWFKYNASSFELFFKTLISFILFSFALKNFNSGKFLTTEISSILFPMISKVSNLTKFLIADISSTLFFAKSSWVRLVRLFNGDTSSIWLWEMYNFSSSVKSFNGVKSFIALCDNLNNFNFFKSFNGVKSSNDLEESSGFPLIVSVSKFFAASNPLMLLNSNTL